MTSHELARKLLEGPDLPVGTEVDCASGPVWSDEGKPVSVTDRGGTLYLAAATADDFGGWNRD